ncbi:DJ-1/PfpI family protein [Aneurinibacillus soli]|uniref:Isonitrile hydratase n=1 Tax=Aneurinibacillus soli TaxID=1500254 RepID=A0A0U5B7M2_9BACL|nr:DJ-1/PfpI family protein [Aneurinibacillus soli]PYE60860.1 DJ-1/PfpI family protein [Aneurinibacillus soli]BAU26765.1 Isonitrile hydratase [Aneurinibacillus soli]
MKRLLLRLVVYVLSFGVFVGGIGTFGYVRSNQEYWIPTRPTPIPALQGLSVPEHNPKKPTVAVLLSNPTTEVIDFMIPYEMFAMTEAYNVYAVAPDKNMKTLSGGLDLMPHYSFDELDRLLGKSPDLIVIPAMPMVDEAKYKPIREWIQKHSDTKLLSICAGGLNLADTGLLKGKEATTDWKSFDFKETNKYPETKWRRDVRYVADGNIVSSAALTSGIDAVLYVISQQLGEPMAEKIAKEMNYPSYHFVKNPKVDPNYVDQTELIYSFNLAFQWNKKNTGVLLYNGMDEGALTAIFDTYANSGTTKVFTISSSQQPIVTKYNLNLIARYQMSNAPKLDKMFVTGTQAKTLAAEDVKQWNEKGNTKEIRFLHSDSTHRFVFDAPLEDLAKQEDILTAKYGAKRLEYRAEHLNFEGRSFSFEAFGILFSLSILAALVAFYIDRRFIMKKKTTTNGCDY